MSRSISIVAVVSLLSAGVAYGDPILCGGHYYELVDHGSGLSWADAKVAAESVEGHHLATITSAAETECIVNNVFPDPPPPPSTAWIGGKQASGGSEPDGGWGWVTGETWAYTNWASGPPQQPDNAGEEECLEMFVHHTVGLPGEWNDFDCGGNPPSREYYIVEWAGPPIPAVSTWGLIVMMLLLVTVGTVVIGKRRTLQM